MDFITATVRDRNGKVISRERHKVKSFVRAWNHILCAQSYANSTTKDTGNTSRIVKNSPANYTCDADAAETTIGIRVGTDNTAVDIEQYALIAPCAEGVGAGQMEHQAQTYNYIGVAGNVCSFETERVMVNNSGGLINVAEAGIYVIGVATDTFNYYFMVARDLITQAVPNGGSITVTYTIRVVA